MSLNHKCNDLNAFTSKSISTHDKKNFGYGNDRDNCNNRDNSKSSKEITWNNKQQNNTNLLQFGKIFGSDDYNIHKRWKKASDSSSKNSSSLALHIAAYENAIEPAGCVDSDVHVPDKNKPPKSWKNLKNFSTGNSLEISLFEFPRQQENASKTSEVMQFKASQVLLNPNNVVFNPNNVGQQTFTASTDPSSSNVTTVSPVPQETRPPTLFKFIGGKFCRMNDGSEDAVNFVFTDNVIFSGEEDLDPIGLEWDAGVLYACFVDENSPNEVVVGLKLTENLEVITDAAYKGPYNQVGRLLNRATDQRTDDPSPAELFKFLISYNFQNPIDQGTPVPATSAPVTAAPATPAPVTPAPATPAPVTPAPGNAVPKKPRKATNIPSSVFEQQRLMLVKNEIAAMASALPEPEYMMLRLDLLVHDFSIRNISESGTNTILELMNTGSWKPDSCVPLNVNKANGRYLVFEGNEHLKAMKQFQDLNVDDSQYKFVKCNVYENLDFCRKLLLTDSSSLFQATTTTMQKLKILREVMERRSITVPKGKDSQKSYSELLNLIFHNDYPPILFQLVELPANYLDALVAVECNPVPFEEIRLETDFWSCFLHGYGKNPSGALNCLAQLGLKTIKEVEKLLKKLEFDLLHYLTERGPHECLTEADAILFFTGDPNFTKNELLKLFKAIRIDHNKSRLMGRYDWTAIKEKIKDYFNENCKYPNAKFNPTFNEVALEGQDFIAIQNPSKQHFDVLANYNQKAVLLLIGNYGNGPPMLTNKQPTAVKKIWMEKPMLIDRIVTALPDPVVKASLYLPGSPEGNLEEKTKYLSEKAQKQNCCWAATMAVEQIYEFASRASVKTKASLCFVSAES